MSSLLDSLERSDPAPLPSRYRDYRISLNPEAYSAAEKLYSCVDALENSTRFDRLNECRSMSWFSRHTETGKVRVMSSSCKLRWCPMCNDAKRAWLVSQVSGWLKTFAEPKFLTLTLKHTNAPLDHQIEWLYKYFRNFRKFAFWNRFVRGGVWFFQVKKSDTDGLWHPHLHILLDSDYMSQWTLSSMWDEVTKGSKIVDIRPVDDPDAAAEYVARYATSPCVLSKLEIDEALEVFHALHGRRIVGRFGTADKIRLTQPKCEDVEKWENIGGWACVTQTADKHVASALILKAWQTDSVLAKGITMDALQLKYDYAALPRLTPEQCQYKFDFYTNH